MQSDNVARKRRRWILRSTCRLCHPGKTMGKKQGQPSYPDLVNSI